MSDEPTGNGTPAADPDVPCGEPTPAGLVITAARMYAALWALWAAGTVDRGEVEAVLRTAEGR